MNLRELLKWPLAWLLRCRACGSGGLPETHYPTCPRLWRNGGEITSSGDAWHKEHGWTREESAAGHPLPRPSETVREFVQRGGRFDYPDRPRVSGAGCAARTAQSTEGRKGGDGSEQCGAGGPPWKRTGSLAKPGRAEGGSLGLSCHDITPRICTPGH